MNFSIKSIAVSAFIVFSAFSAVQIQQLQTWSISEDYSIAFDGKGAKGSFSGLDGRIVFDPDNLGNSEFDVWVDVATIDTGNKTKNKHARGKRWFGADEHPKITFKSESFSKNSTGYVVSGMLSIRGISQEVEIPFSVTPSGNQQIFEGSITVTRKTFGIDGPALTMGVGDEFEVSIRVPVDLV
jgi:polyisoprenoid-binding protein YceI